MKTIIPNVSIVQAPGAIFGTAITSDDISVLNYQVLSFVISSSAGNAAANTTVTVEAKKGAGGTPEAVSFLIKEVGSTSKPTVQKSKSISVGGATSAKSFIISLTADMLAGTGYDTIVLKTTAISGNETVGSVIALQEQPRYSI